jgi:IS30 family transposase
MTLIAERPVEVATRAMPGHWEGDLLKGARNGSAVGTLVERTTRLVILARLEGTNALSAREGFTRKLKHVPTPLRKTLTYDRGKEMAEHERLAQLLAIRVFFADPHSPWQRGTNENTNGLLSQHLPKGTDLSGYTQRELNTIAQLLNTRPRKCLDWATPLEVFTQLRHHSPRCTWNLKPPLQNGSRWTQTTNTVITSTMIYPIPCLSLGDLHAITP